MARIAIKGLESAGHLKLAPVTSPFPPDKPRGSGLAQLKLPPIRATLKQIQPVELIEIGSRHSQRARQCRHLLERFHPLGARLCGCQLRYLIVCPQGILGVLSFSAASRRLQPRDQWIGWDDATRAENLHRIVNNSRFLIRPDGELKHLASHVLALAIRRLPQDWEQRYGYRPWLLESFVDKLKYRGCSYRAANWIELEASTTGRGRNDRHRKAEQPVKRIFVYPLLKKSRSLLGQLPQIPRLARHQPTPRPRPDPQDWAEEEFGRAELGDERLRKRLMMLQIKAW